METHSEAIRVLVRLRDSAERAFVHARPGGGVLVDAAPTSTASDDALFAPQTPAHGQLRRTKRPRSDPLPRAADGAPQPGTPVPGMQQHPGTPVPGGGRSANRAARHGARHFADLDVRGVGEERGQ